MNCKQDVTPQRHMSGPTKVVAIVIPIILILFGMVSYVVIGVGSAFYGGPTGFAGAVLSFFIVVAILIPVGLYAGTSKSCPICRSHVWRPMPTATVRTPSVRVPLSPAAAKKRRFYGRVIMVALAGVAVCVVGYAAADLYITADDRAAAAAEASRAERAAAVAERAAAVAERAAPNDRERAAREYERAAAEWTIARE